MKTQGVVIVEGYLILPYRDAAPAAFWSRLKHQATKAGLIDEYRKDCADEGAARDAPVWERKERLFRRWVEKLNLMRLPWPWEPGWTHELADSYLDPAPPPPHWSDPEDGHAE
jgi:hypothetical protein